MKRLLTYLFFVFSLGFIINLTNINLSHALFEKGICASNTYGSQIKVKYSYSGKCKDLGAFFISKNDYPSYQGKKYSGFDGSGANKKYGASISISSMMNSYRNDEIINKVYNNFEYYKKNKNYNFYIIDTTTFSIGKFKNGEFIADGKIDKKNLKFCADLFLSNEKGLRDGYFTDTDLCPLQTTYQIADKIKWDFSYSSNFSKVYYDQESFYITDDYYIFLGKKQTQIAKAEPSQTQSNEIDNSIIGYCISPSSVGYNKLVIVINTINSICSHHFISKKLDNEIFEFLKNKFGKKISAHPLPITGYSVGQYLIEIKSKTARNPQIEIDLKSTDNDLAKLEGEKKKIEEEKRKIKEEKKRIADEKEKLKQEEFKPENKDIDNDAPIIEIAQNIIVDSQTYTLKGKVKDKSKFQLTIDDRPIKVAKNGQFEFEGFAIDTKEKLKIVAIDRWKNKSEKVINVEVKIKQVADLRSYEKPNPRNIKVKKDNNKIGIIIGIEKYQNLNNIDAPYANRDANAFRAYANRALGIPNKNIKVLIDENATRGETLKVLTLWLPQIARGKNKDIYVFFAGHGLASDDGKNLYILPQDGDAALLQYTALSRLEIFDLINRVEPNSVTMFFDTCYSGQTRDERMLVAGLRPIRLVAEEQEVQNNFTIFTASNYDQTSGSIEEAKHGIFSYYLMMGMQGKADTNRDKKITNGELIAYLKQNVSEEAFINNRQQEPMLSGDPDKVLIKY